MNRKHLPNPEYGQLVFYNIFEGVVIPYLPRKKQKGYRYFYTEHIKELQFKFDISNEIFEPTAEDIALYNQHVLEIIPSPEIY